MTKRLSALIMALGLTAFLVPMTSVGASSSYWNVAGSYGVNVTWDQDPAPGTVYPEALILTQAGAGTITGSSLDYAGGCSLFTLTGGSVTGNAITVLGNACLLALTMTGTIDATGAMSGTWRTTPDGRSGTWWTTTGAANFLDASTHAQSDLVRQIKPGVNGSVVGGVIFNSSAGSPNNLEFTLMLKKVTANTEYDVYLFVDGWASGTGIVLGSLTTNGVGNGTFHVNTLVTPGIHTVAVDVTLHGSGSDLYVTPGLYGQDFFLYLR